MGCSRAHPPQGQSGTEAPPQASLVSGDTLVDRQTFSVTLAASVPSSYDFPLFWLSALTLCMSLCMSVLMEA